MATPPQAIASELPEMLAQLEAFTGGIRTGFEDGKITQAELDQIAAFGATQIGSPRSDCQAEGFLLFGSQGCPTSLRNHKRQRRPDRKPDRILGGIAFVQWQQFHSVHKIFVTCGYGE